MSHIDNFFNCVVVVDTETTGVDTKKAELVEVASGQLIDGQWQTEALLFGTLRPIPPEACAIHYISNRMVEGLPTVDDQFPRMGELLRLNFATAMVAHNASFDRSIIFQAYARCSKQSLFEAFSGERDWICTWRLAKAVLGIDYARIQYGLGYLRYYLELDVDDDMPAHRAAADVTTCGRLLEKLLILAIEKNMVDSEEEILPQLISLCWDPIPITKWTIGKKHAGDDLQDIPTNYYMWAIANIDELDENNSRFNRDLANSIEKILIKRNVI